MGLMHQGLKNGPFLPHNDTKSGDPCFFAKVPDGPQTYTLNILWIQEKGAQIHMSEGSQRCTLAENMCQDFILSFTPPT